MLGDTGVAVHPDDERYTALVGQGEGEAAARRPRDPDRRRRVRRPREGLRRGEDHARRTTSTTSRSASGTACRMINIFDAERPTSIERGAGRATAASTASTARKRVVADLEALGLRREDRDRRGHTVPHGDRSGAVDRAVADRPVVRERRRAGEARDRGGGDGQDRLRAEELGEDLLRLDAQHPALVHLAPALVGPPDPGLVRARTAKSSSPTTRGGGRRRWPRKHYGQRRAARQRRGRARHLVLLRAVAVLDARLARQDAGARRATTRPTCSSPASTSSSSGSPA